MQSGLAMTIYQGARGLIISNDLTLNPPIYIGAGSLPRREGEILVIHKGHLIWIPLD